MTKYGKCDTCRARKVKCDEVRPVCSGCQRRRRLCQYGVKKQPLRFVVDARQKFESTLSLEHEPSLGPPDPGQASRAPCGARIEETQDLDARLVISLRRSRLARVGGGMFCNFVTTRRPAADDAHQEADIKHPTNVVGELPRRRQGIRKRGPLLLQSPPSSDSMGLLGRWVHWSTAASEGYDLIFILGNWMRPVPWRIGQSPAVDCAVDCFLKCVTSFEHSTPEGIINTHIANAKALKMIRCACETDKSVLGNGDVLLAICLLFHVEARTTPCPTKLSYLGPEDKTLTTWAKQLLMESRSRGWQWHMQGFIKLLQQVSKKGTYRNDIIDVLLEYCIYFEYRDCIQGHDSSFDTPTWLSVVTSSDFPVSYRSMLFDVSSVQACNCELSIRLPRLVRLVRQAREAPSDAEPRRAAVQLARELYRLDHDDTFQDMLARGIVKVVPSSGEEVLESFLDFTSYCAFCIFINYWGARVLLCGLILSLADISPVMPWIYDFDPDLVAAQDVQAAQYLAMSLPFAMRSPTRLPLTALRFVLPLDLSFGAWHRLESRAGGPGATGLDAERASMMKRWIQGWLMEMAYKWCRLRASPTTALEFFETKAEIYMGSMRDLLVTSPQ